MNAIQFLLKEHDHVRDVFSKIENGLEDKTAQRGKFYALCDELIVHEKMEQTVWYPFLKKHKDIAKIIPHLRKEEKKAEKLIKEIFSNQTQAWKRQFQKLKKEVEHHASEEEQNFFPAVKEILSSKDLGEIGKEMAAFKKENLKKKERPKRKKVR